MKLRSTGSLFTVYCLEYSLEKYLNKNNIVETILEQIRKEITKVREESRAHSRANRNKNYAENTMYMEGLYKAMSIVVDSIEDEYKALNKWADEESKQIND
jgi:hypothetical protein